MRPAIPSTNSQSGQSHGLTRGTYIDRSPISAAPPQLAAAAGGAALSPTPAAPRPATPMAPMNAEYRLGQLTPGQMVLDRYSVKRELGRGGMGAVYLADDSKLGELVALKVISS